MAVGSWNWLCLQRVPAMLPSLCSLHIVSLHGTCLPASSWPPAGAGDVPSNERELVLGSILIIFGGSNSSGQFCAEMAEREMGDCPSYSPRGYGPVVKGYIFVLDALMTCLHGAGHHQRCTGFPTASEKEITACWEVGMVLSVLLATWMNGWLKRWKIGKWI